MQALTKPTPLGSDFVTQLETVIKNDPGKTTNTGRFVQILQNALPCQVAKIKGSKSEGKENDFGSDSTVFKCTVNGLDKALAIKVLTDTWPNSKNIYDKPELFKKVNNLQCTSNILSTFTYEIPHAGSAAKIDYRVVIYDFVEGHISKNPEDIAQVKSGLKSIGKRFIGTESDIIVREADQQPILTDWDSIVDLPQEPQ